MHEAGRSGLVHWDDPERWDGEGGGREGQDGETHAYPWLIQWGSSCLGNPMGSGAWQARVHESQNSQALLSN